VGDLGEAGYENYLKGVTPKLIPIRAAARYQTSHPDHAWLNRLQCINVGEADVRRLSLRYDVYAVR
jgi:hypothetical protein